MDVSTYVYTTNIHTHPHTLHSLLSLSLTHMLLESSLSECVKGRAWGVRHATAVEIEVKLNKPSWGQQQCNRYCSNKHTQQMVLLASLSEEDKEACLKAFTGETCYKCRPADDKRCVCVCACVCVCMDVSTYVYTHPHTLYSLCLSRTHMLLESNLSECVKGRAWGCDMLQPSILRLKRESVVYWYSI
jgi:hypothetical protein